MREVAYRKWAWSGLVLWTIGNRIYRREDDDLFRRIETYPHVQVSMVRLLGTFFSADASRFAGSQLLRYKRARVRLGKDRENECETLGI